jgi:hypothetical protein
MATPVAIVYLDVDDEITSAAARIRAAEEVRVAIVLPAGSRLATSRINFRLLAREAQGRSRQLLIVSPEGATRALAASAGLTVFPTVRELEDSFAAPGDDGTAGAAGSSGSAVAGATAAGVLAAGAAEDEGGGVGAAAGADGTAGSGSTGVAAGAGGAAGPGWAAGAAGAGAAVAGSAARRSQAVPRIEPAPTVAMPTPAPSGGGPTGVPSDPADAGLGRGLGGRSAGASLPVVSSGRRPGGTRTAWIATGLALLFVAIVAVVLGYLFLPAATIVVTPKVEPIGPLTFVVTADPTATATDVAAGVVPATVATFPLQASGDFPATGRKVAETRAGGTVTFSNVDPFAQHTIASGSLVQTPSGIGFLTQRTVVLPRAALTGLVIVPTNVDVPVRAVSAGTSGNVPAGAISIVPPDQNPAKIKVRNKAATTGGTHTETAIVAQRDIDKATVSLTKQLNDQLTAAIADPAQVLPGSTVFPDTKSMSKPVPTPDPSTLVGQPVASFSYGLSATGSVTAVDTTEVQNLATERLRGSVSAGHDLVSGSLQVTVGKGKVVGDTIVFAIRATASEVARLDPDELRNEVRGKTKTEAEQILSEYGAVTITLWPGFSDRIPVYDARIDLTVSQPLPVETSSPGPGGSSSPAGSSVPAVSTSPGASGASAPSGGAAAPSAAP